MDGQSNTQILRDWFENNPDYAACQTDFAHGWYLPSAGQLRKLYAALPMVESIIINANGTLMTENDYWSSTERGSGTAWTPSFAMGYNNKGMSCRVRAISGVTSSQEIVTQTTEFSEGWNWFSVYIDMDPIELLHMLEAALGENGVYIESSDLLSTEYLEGEWIGDLEEVGILSGRMYLIQTVTPCTIELQGLPANPVSNVITIYPEWNWVGFPCSEEMTIAEALAGFVPENGDQIESMEDYAEYLDGEWIGIETLKPGQGFLYYSNSTEPKTFTFPVSAK
jgi:hypothetical protein